MNNEKLSQELKRIKEAEHWSWRIMAEEITSVTGESCNKDHLCGVTTGSSPNERIPKLAEQWLKEYHKSRAERTKRMATDGLKHIQEILTDSAELYLMSVVTGKPGSGKPESLKEFAETHEGVKYVACNTYTTMNVLMDQILGPQVTGSAARKLEICKKELQGWLLIVDELDCTTIRVMEGLRAIFDNGGMGLVMAGTPRLIKMLTKGDLAQLFSRVDYFYNLENPSEDELEEYLDRQNITNKDARKMIRETVRRGSFRSGVKTIRQSKRIARLSNREVDSKVISAAQQLIFSKAY